MRGQRGKAIRSLCDALGWTPDSIERILDGGEPQLVAGSDPARLDAIERGLAEVRAQVRALADRVGRQEP